MITVTCIEGRTGSNKKREAFRQGIDKRLALSVLRHDLDIGFKLIGKIRRNKILIERLSQNFTRTEYRTYMGPPAEMKILVSLAKIQKPA